HGPTPPPARALVAVARFVAGWLRPGGLLGGKRVDDARGLHGRWMFTDDGQRLVRGDARLVAVHQPGHDAGVPQAAAACGLRRASFRGGWSGGGWTTGVMQV